MHVLRSYVVLWQWVVPALEDRCRCYTAREEWERVALARHAYVLRGRAASGLVREDICPRFAVRQRRELDMSRRTAKVGAAVGVDRGNQN